MEPATARSTAEAEPAIAVTGLRKSYAGQTAVRDASFSVPQSSITALLGPNGAGKTTTLETIAGLQRADEGQVRVLGTDPWHAATAHRARIGVMLQGGGVWSTATATQAVGNVARFYADPMPVELLLDSLHLTTKQRNTPYRRLSGGEQQRVKLACAIVGRPFIAILDEPSSGLDPATRRDIWSLIEDLKAHGMTILLSTHSMEEAEALADHVVIMADGRVVLAGHPAALTQNTDRHCLWFRADRGLPRTDLLSHLPPGSSLTEESPGRYCLQGQTVTPQTIAQITSWCAEHGILATDLQVSQRSLEDVFLEVTKS